MHTAEALLAVNESTREGKYLHRAEAVAQKFTVDLATLADGQVWEHYTTE